MKIPFEVGWGGGVLILGFSHILYVLSPRRESAKAEPKGTFDVFELYSGLGKGV